MSLLSDSREINLIIEGQVFKVYKNILCEHSDYFSAMFSGNYVEEDKTDITIDVVDAESMDIILRYINVGLIDLSEFSLKTIGTLAMASNFLQITELNTQIEYWLDMHTTVSNWMEIMIIAEKASYLKLQQMAGSFGLLSFKNMKPEYVPNLQKLFWYLSHPYLDTCSELDVFKFGYKWILHPETCVCADILLIILGCLDMKRLTCQDLKEIILMLDNCENSLAGKVIECLKMLLDNKLPITMEVLQKFGMRIRETFADSVYNEVINLVQNSNERKLQYTAVTAVWMYKNGDLAFVPHYLYTFTKERHFESWLEVADKNMWGWNMTVWGANKIVLVCGEYGRGIGRYMTDVKIYDTLRQEWIQHGAKLPCRRHAGVAVLGDSLFIVGGVGQYRVVEDTTIIYDLRNRSFRKAARFPEAIQSPALCPHYGSMYASSLRHIYKYEDMGNRDKWVTVLDTEIRPTYMISYKDYIYCSQNYFSALYRFRPGMDVKLEMVTQLTPSPVAYCNMGNNYMITFSRATCQGVNTLTVEQYDGPCRCPEGTINTNAPGSCCIKLLWEAHDAPITINDVAGVCAVVMSMPKVDTTPSSYHQRYLTHYGEITYNMGVEEMAEET